MAVFSSRARKIGRRTTALLSVSAMVFALLTVVGVTSAAAASIRLVSPTGTDAGDCQISACRTIGYAINLANGGDTISVAAGSYSESVVVSKPLTIQGAGTGAASTRSGAESVVEPATGSPFTVTASDVTIKNFTITAHTGSDAIYMSGSYTGETIANNIINAALRAVNFTTGSTTIKDNLITLSATSTTVAFNLIFRACLCW